MRNIRQQDPRDGLPRLILDVEASARRAEHPADASADHAARRMLRFHEGGSEIGKHTSLRRMGCCIGGSQLEIIKRHGR